MATPAPWPPSRLPPHTAPEEGGGPRRRDVCLFGGKEEQGQIGDYKATTVLENLLTLYTSYARVYTLLVVILSVDS